MAKFDSTSLPQTNEPKEIQKMGLDLLDKINKVQAELDPLQSAAAITDTSFGKPYALYAVLLSGVGVADTNWHALDVIAAGAPTDTKAVFVNAGAADGTNFRTIKVSNASGGNVLVTGTVLANGYMLPVGGMVPVDANGKIWYALSFASLTGVSIIMTTYYK